MRSFPVGVAVTVSIPLVDLNGDPVSPTGLVYRVIDENEIQVAAPITVGSVDSTLTDLEVVVPGNVNVLGAGQVSGLRVVVLAVTSAAGTFEIESSYVLRATQRLVVMENSFQPYRAALLVAEDMVRVEDFRAADDAARQSALIEAYQRLTRLGYLIRWPENVDAQNCLHWRQAWEITPLMWPLIDQTQFMTYPENFRKAISRAQVAEANALLKTDVLGDRRRAGLFSEKIGESSIMFRQGKPLDLGMSSEALECLSGYVNMRMTITRS